MFPIRKSGSDRFRSRTIDDMSATTLGRRDLLRASLVGGAAMLSGATVLASRVRAGNGDATLRFDVACDGRTWRFDAAFADLIDDPMSVTRGTRFLVNGKIYPEGTIEAGLSGPDQEGAIGTWVCRGSFNHDMAEIVEGAVPHAATTQFYLFDDGAALYSEGLEGGVPVSRAITGGVEAYLGARGAITQEEVGTNDTELAGLGMPAPNIKFGFHAA